MTEPHPAPLEPTTLSARFFRLIKPVAAFSVSEVARKGQLSAIDQGVISAGNFLASVLVSRYVSPTEFGIYTVGFLAVLFVRAVQEGLIIQPLNSIGAGLDADEFRAYVSATGLAQLILALASAAAAAGIGWLLTAAGNDMAGPTLFALWFSFLTWQFQEFIRRVFYTRGQVLRAVVNTLLQNLVRILLVIWLGTSHQLSGIGGLNAIGWGGLAAFAVGFWQARGLWTARGLKLRATWEQNWKFGRWTLGGTVLNWVAVQFYPILTAGMISFAATGAYQALQNLVAPIHVLLRASDTFLTPRISKIYAREGFQPLRRVMKLSYLLLGIPVGLLLLGAVEFSAPLLHLLRGDTYLPFRQGIYLLAIFYALWYAYWPLQTALKAIRFSRPIFIANALAIVTMLTVGLWAIQRWGIYGTMAGQVLNALIINLVLWLSWRKVSLQAKS